MCLRKNGMTAVVEALLKNKADINFKDNNYKYTPLHWAVLDSANGEMNLKNFSVSTKFTLFHLCVLKQLLLIHVILTLH